VRKPISINFELDNIKQLDVFIHPPVSRSDLINDILEYMLKNPDTIKHFVKTRQQQIEENL